jgi:hypothetical protein
MTIGGLGTYGSIYDVRVNQSTKAKNTASSDFSKTMDSAAEMSTVRSRESVRESVVTRHTEYATYACVNYGEAVCPEDIREQAICIDGDIGTVIDELRK